jgi:hypothetical protein
MSGMIQSFTQTSARFEFAKRAELNDELRRRLALELATVGRNERAKTEKERERRENAEFAAALKFALATPEQIAAFTVRLDTYDTATVEALLANQEALDAVKARIDDLLLKAHTLPDGRRVFKTEDGTI